MNKHLNLLLFIILSILMVFLIREMHVVVRWIDIAHQWIINSLALIISGGEIARIIRLSLGLILVPLIIALIPAFIYWIFKRSWLPYYMTIVWVIWLILVTILAYR